MSRAKCNHYTESRVFGRDNPVCSVPLEPSDRFLLYTDGVTETENAAGEAFGDRQLERVVRNNRLQPASELSRQVLSELQRWRTKVL